MSSTTSAAPSSTTTTSSDGSGGTFFSSGGSTLILAFLAIGLFVGGLLVMFSMRRYVSRNRRRMRAWQTSGERSWGWDPATLLMDMNSPTRRQEDFGEKPELWNVRVATTSRTWAGDWEKATPIAISLYADPHPSSARSHNATASSSTSPPPGSGYLHPFRIGLRDTRAQIASLRVPWLRQASSSAGASSQGSVDSTPQPSGSAERGAARVEVALAIALPTQTPCAQGSIPLFALGVTNMRWGSEPLAQQDLSSPPPRHSHTDDTSRRS
ncbi:hypothetical protein LXA43DRAFT_1100543 [Ganoderma leucocontextum]|nr:hypothetical protein LXA43DRAFT_1100543 [Ganoderma leucocontextum]